MNQEINVSLLSRYKTALMGLSMLMIMLCHTNVGFSAEQGIISPFFSEILQAGVVIFFCLSGLGCYYSFHRTPSVLAFYKKRILRVLPSYILVIAVYGVFRFLAGAGAEGSWKDYLWLYSPLSFWVDGYLAEWFISAILVLYLLFPILYYVINKGSALSLGLLIGANVAAVFVFRVYGARPMFVINEIFFTRTPAFLIGIYLGKRVIAQKDDFTVPYWQVCLIFAVSFLICVVNYRVNRIQFVFIHRMMMAPLGVAGCLLLGTQWASASKQWIVQKLTFVGGMTLELYLTHEKILHVLQIILRFFNARFGYFAFTLVSNILAIAMALVCAAIVKRIAGFCTKKITYKTNLL